MIADVPVDREIVDEVRGLLDQELDPLHDVTVPVGRSRCDQADRRIRPAHRLGKLVVGAGVLGWALGADLPGTIGLTPEILAAILERVSEQAIATGFKNVIVMGDHGGGQPQTYAEVAKKMDGKYAPEGKHVYFCDEVYAKAQGDFDKWLQDHGYPSSSHAGIPDTSTMLYLGGDKGWVRKELIATAEGDPAPPPGARGRGRGADPNAPPRKNNGITGDARKSTAALGKMAFDIKIDYAVKQIQGFLGTAGKTTAQQ